MSTTERDTETGRDTGRERHTEQTAFLEMAGRLRRAMYRRNEAVRLYRDRYDRAQDDLRVSPEKRVVIASQFLEAVQIADHAYDDSVGKALEGFCEAMTGRNGGG
jgi:alkanesulfonate monooxygenase SsuD/methylene tetrahydromethanopterin reductase-like flavin-dependent oxidoreductase (luciferase family)